MPSIKSSLCALKDCAARFMYTEAKVDEKAMMRSPTEERLWKRRLLAFCTYVI